MKRVSLTQYLVERQREKGLIPGELRLLLEVVARACKRISLAVSKGDQVAAGELLGTVGMTGNTTGPHLHLELWHGAKPIDPLTVLPVRP